MNKNIVIAQIKQLHRIPLQWVVTSIHGLNSGVSIQDL